VLTVRTREIVFSGPFAVIERSYPNQRATSSVWMPALVLVAAERWRPRQRARRSLGHGGNRSAIAGPLAVAAS
jgi:hypothetical protein